MTALPALNARVGSLPSSSPRLAQGASGPAVQELQTLLNSCGLYGKNVDGKFGPLTEAAVREFQRRQGLEPNGLVGAGTLAALRRVAASSASSVARLVRGAAGPAVQHLQSLLRRVGLYRANLGGHFGPLTDAAVRAFQARHGLTVDGWAGPKTMAVLERLASGSAGPVHPGNVGPVPGSPAPAGAGVQAAINYGKSVLGSPYAAVNPFRFGDVPWDGGRHQSVNGSGTWWQYPRGTRVFDCSGFVVACFRRAGVDLLSKGLATSGAIAANSNGFLQNLTRDQLRPGDLITYRSASDGVGHVVIYLGEGRTLESSGSGGVKYGLVDWSRANAFRRVPVP